MKTFYQYLQERFPPIPVLLYAFGYAGMVIGTTTNSHFWITHPMTAVYMLLLVAGIFLCFLFRQRAIDEFRDFKHDAKYFPNRPIHRGLVTSRQIVVWGLVALFFELIFAFLIAPPIWYLPVFLYTILMAKDFFIKSWLDKHFTTHFFIHELFFVIFGSFFVFNLSNNDVGNQIVVNILILVLAPMSVELVRKFKPRSDTKGNIVKDSYVAVWGRIQTIIFLILLTLGTAAGLSWLSSNPTFLIVATMISFLMWIFKKNNKIVMILGATQYVLLALISNII